MSEMTSNESNSLPAADPGQDRNRRALTIAGAAVGAAAVVFLAYELLSGGSGTGKSLPAPLVRPTHTVPVPTASASPSPESVLESAQAPRVDPFQVSARILAALAPPVTAAPTSVASGTPRSAGATAAAGTGSSPLRVQFIQLLGAKKSGSKWLVTVRTQSGTCTGVKEGAVKVCGTDFSFLGEDGQSGRATFIFVFGEVQGGNLVPNATLKPVPVIAGDSALIAVNGRVDGGISA